MLRSVQFTERLGNWSAQTIHKSLKPETRFLVMTGNFGNPIDNTFHSRIRALTQKYEKVVLVPGLRELYHPRKSLADMFHLLYSASVKNPKLEILHNRDITLDGISIYGSVMWPEPKDLPVDIRPRVVHYNEVLSTMSDQDLEALRRRALGRYKVWRNRRPEFLYAVATHFKLPVPDDNTFYYQTDRQ